MRQDKNQENGMRGILGLLEWYATPEGHRDSVERLLQEMHYPREIDPEFEGCRVRYSESRGLEYKNDTDWWISVSIDFFCSRYRALAEGLIEREHVDSDTCRMDMDLPLRWHDQDGNMATEPLFG